MGSRHIVINHMKKVRDSFETDFTPANLGFERFSRDEIAEMRTTLSCNIFLKDNLQPIITIWDCTYVYTHKSDINTFQRMCYSMHKSRPHVKPMVCLAPNGFIIDVIGPYPANQNDAEVLQHILNNMPVVSSKFQRDDIFVVDRGFRDATSYLKNNGFTVKMPELVPSGQSQLSDLSANRSRLVTKIRYVVETINGNLKTMFRYFDHVWQTQSLPHLMSDFRNAAAIHNVFHARFISDVDDAEVISNLMLSALDKKNIMGQLVTKANLNRSVTLSRSITDLELPDFPILVERELYLIALGHYQIKQAKSYFGEHVVRDGRFRIELYTDDERISIIWFRS